MNKKEWKYDISLIRNFTIIAHIDHGKTTLSDRIIEITLGESARSRMDRYLDRLRIERERGITIKAQTVRLYYTKDGINYQFNLIDTPGHVDFSYEVSRSLAACECSILVVDATQGVEAQTISNVYKALEYDHEIIPVINKIDLKNAEPDRVKREITEIIGIDGDEALLVSAKLGDGVKELLDRIVDTVPPPKGDPSSNLACLVFDSWYDSYRGAIALFRVKEGTIKEGDEIQFFSTKERYRVESLFVSAPEPIRVQELRAGEVGFLAAHIKDLDRIKIGDTITHPSRPVLNPLPGFREQKPMVFCGIYPADPDDYEQLRDSLAKLRLNDSSIKYEPETSQALGFGFRCGFLGLLHMEVVQQRLLEEFGLSVVCTVPTVVYRVKKTDGTIVEVENPSQLPPLVQIDTMYEPIIEINVHCPKEYVGNVLKLLEEKRGKQKSMEFINDRVVLTYILPLNEVIVDFHDRLKSCTRGFGSMDYEIIGYEESDLVLLTILINNNPVDSLSFIVHSSKAYYIGRKVVDNLAELIPRQLFDVAIQAAIGRRVIARKTVKALRKNVLAKCYGGDVSRKKKLLEKQKEGKKKMKRIGKVEIPQEAFVKLLKLDQTK